MTGFCNSSLISNSCFLWLVYLDILFIEKAVDDLKGGLFYAGQSSFAYDWRAREGSADNN